jgi:hypothetical protein
MSGSPVRRSSLSRRPEKPNEIRALKRIHQLRQASAWAPVVWFPLVLVLVSVGASHVALGLGISGAVFSAILRGVVATSRCPRCEGRYSSMPGGFHEIWHGDRCAACGFARYPA